MKRSPTMDLVRRAGRLPLASMLERRLVALGVGEHGSMLVAVSGGADSTALLLLSTAVARRRGWRIEAATVDHHLREGSEADACHAVEVAESIGVPCARLDVRPGSGPGAPERARHERYRALAEHARRRDLRAVVTAHHATDQLETMLLSMMRGAGARAAGGMRGRRRLGEGVELLRPLLMVPGEALPQLCRRLGVTWRHDPTNDDASSPRVHLRRHVIPVLEAARPGSAVRAARMGALLRVAGGAFERRARRLLARASLEAPLIPDPTQARAQGRGGGAVGRIDQRMPPAPLIGRYARAILARAPEALRMEAVRQVLRAVGATGASHMVERIDAAVVDAARHERSWRLSSGATLRLVADRLEVISASSARDPDARRRSRGRR